MHVTQNTLNRNLECVSHYNLAEIDHYRIAYQSNLVPLLEKSLDKKIVPSCAVLFP